ncbi:MAG: energy-coupling factor transporter transmembrane protein EcfT [Spirochaetaceae bacterium]|nr:energy-coupling factor transporter transmembrane protein EcfT [Spirochaetaceae bacterium]
MARQRLNPFAFEPGASPLARLHPVAKLIFLLAITSLVMKSGVTLLLALALAATVLQWGLPLHGGASIGFVLWLSLFAAIVRGVLPGDGRLFDPATLGPSAYYALRLVAVFLFSRAFYATTRIAEIGDWITAGWRLLRKALIRIRPSRRTGNVIASARGSVTSPGGTGDAIEVDTDGSAPHADIADDPGIFITLTLLFLPRIFDLYTRIDEAGEIRGIRLRRRNVLRSLGMLQQLVFAGMRQAYRTSLAMEVRGYNPDRALRLRPFNAADWAVMAVPLLLLLLF